MVFGELEAVNADRDFRQLAAKLERIERQRPPILSREANFCQRRPWIETCQARSLVKLLQISPVLPHDRQPALAPRCGALHGRRRLAFDLAAQPRQNLGIGLNGPRD